MAGGAYNLRFVMSMTDRTRNSFNKLISDTRKLSRYDRELANAYKDVNMQMRANSTEQTKLRRSIEQQIAAQKRSKEGIDTQIRKQEQLRAKTKALRLELDRLNTTEIRAIGRAGVSASRAAQLKPTDTSARAMKIRADALADAMTLNNIKEAKRLKKLDLDQNIRGLRQSQSLQMKSAWARAKSVAQVHLLNKALNGTILRERQLAHEADRAEMRLLRRNEMYHKLDVAQARIDRGRYAALRALIVGAAAGYAGQQAATFETSTTKAATQVSKGGQSPQAISVNSVRLQRDILDMMGKFPARAQDMSDSAYQIFSAMNVNYKQGTALLKAFNAVAVAGATDLATATSAGITLFNTFGGTAKENAKVLDSAFAIVRLGRMEFEDFNNMLNAVAPVAKATGQSLTDVGGAMAFVTSRIPSQRQSAISIARLLEVFARRDFRDGMKKLGATIEDEKGNLLALPKIISQVSRLPVAQQKSTLGEVIPFVTAAGRGGGKGVQATVQARRALALMLDQGAEYRDIQRQILGAQGEFQRRYEAMMGTTGVQWERTKANMQAIVIILGRALIPWLDKIVQKFQQWANYLKDNQGILVFGAGLVAAYVAVMALSAAINTFIGVMGAFYATLNLVSGGAFIMGKGKGGGGKGLKGLAIGLGRVGLAAAAAAAAIGGVMAVVKEVQNTNFEGNWMQRIAKGVSDFGSGALSAVMGIVPGGDTITKQTTRFDNWLEGTFKGIFGKSTPKKATTNKAAKEAKSLWEEIQKEIMNAGDLTYNEEIMGKFMKSMGLDVDAMNQYMNGGDAANTKQKMAKAVVDEYKSIKDQVESSLESIYSGFQTQNETMMGGLFNGPWMNSDRYKWFEQFGVGPTIGDMTKDMRMANAQFAKTRQNLATLGKKGIPPEVLDELRAMGEDGLVYIQALTKGTPKEIQKFLQAWKTRKKSIQDATDIDFTDKIKRWQQTGRSLADGLATGFSSSEDHMKSVINTTITNVFDEAIRTMAVQAVALQAAAAAALSNNPIPDNLKADPIDKEVTAWAANNRIPVDSVVYKMPPNFPTWSYTTAPGGFGNPGVMGRAGGQRNPFAPPVNLNPNGNRSLSNAGNTYTEIYNVSGFSPDDAFRNLEQKRAFRMRNRRR